MTPEVGRFILHRLLALRRSCIVTSSTLQQEVAKWMQTKLTAAAVRKFLNRKGYKWLPRAQKRKYSREDMKKRLAFAQKISRLGKGALRTFITMAIDGVILSIAPQDEADRLNYCWHGETHMYRKANEAAKPELAGDDPYPDQVPLARSIPLWAGISPCGVCEIVFHRSKKLTTAEWTHDVLKQGKLAHAINKLQPARPTGPRRILCDNEKFLYAKASNAHYKEHNIALLRIPARSPDLNPIEMFWAWVRRQLRLKDLDDLKSGCQVLGKAAMKSRVKALLKSKKAQKVAGNIFFSLKKKCAQVVKRKGAAIKS